MKEYYIFETPCLGALTEDEFAEIQQLKKLNFSSEEIKGIMRNHEIRRNCPKEDEIQQTIVIASHIDEAIATIRENSLSWDTLLFVGTLPLSTKKIDYLDFVEYAPHTELQKISEGEYKTHILHHRSPIVAWGCPHIILRRVRNGPLEDA